jgi:hypothetical protein
MIFIERKLSIEMRIHSYDVKIFSKRILPCFWCSTEQYEAVLHAEHRNNLTWSAVLPQMGHLFGSVDIYHQISFNFFQKIFVTPIYAYGSDISY